MLISSRKLKKIIKEEVQNYIKGRLDERSTVGPARLAGENNSARWTPPGKERKLSMEQLSGYQQMEFPKADKPAGIDDEYEGEMHIDLGTSAKYNNKVRVYRTEDGELMFNYPKQTKGFSDVGSTD